MYVVQMVEEASKAFGPEDELPARQVVDDMDYTVSALKASRALRTSFQKCSRDLSVMPLLLWSAMGAGLRCSSSIFVACC